ncbi:MAG: hypothetical protein E6R03_08715 [Hyphomicrobiaceae bacterium]|nr:MAG: hypothetical protein E6R03_08715 [Hyphomicrobiaceae bacterium]
MIGAVYLVLEWSPFPGVYAPMATCFLQDAERGIGGIRHYHDGAARLQSRQWGDELYLYPYARAQQLVEYTERQRPYTRHKLIAYHPGTIEPFRWNQHGDGG